MVIIMNVFSRLSCVSVVSDVVSLVVCSHCVAIVCMVGTHHALWCCTIVCL